MTNIDTDGGFIRVTGTEAELCRLVAQRQQLGIRKYGTTVRDNPLTHRQWLQHGLEEALDLACYLLRSIEEIDRSGAGHLVAQEQESGL